MMHHVFFFFFQAEDGIRDHAQSRGLGDVYKRQTQSTWESTRSGLVFPCGRIGRYLKSSFPNFRQSSGSKVYMAAVLEYLAAEIIELAGNYSVQGKKSRIQPIHIKYAIRDDEELSKFLTNIILNEGGNVQSNFQLPILKKKQKETQIEEEKK
eukprot:TRINITY_DN23727_c0_g1_i1.p2 TRINITY_DN23727_c0_g1~~TRINITY_DN23727_c0_g1_i1.p2  ORF type:complete len:153 (-),score=42.74 TRINITY_DN23727_c0_g1_i1:281-739(-)